MAPGAAHRSSTRCCTPATGSCRSTSTGRVDRLRELIAGADLVLEASRPRALQQLGIHAEEVVAQGTSWLSITAAGRDSDTVGFGDDVAVRGGLRTVVGGRTSPVGDAIADPLTGVVAATAAVAVLEAEPALIDVSMLHVAAAAARGETAEHRVVRGPGDAWWVETDAGRWPVAPPRRRGRER